ncbi:Aste57867_17574 [Aphanomyces stellatus]|uniref:Aste57867_17574 protein n=1 Tax=Aphanomyces stellatus TaxID=120398 RepID=A0A485L9R5_9STRA|nr:hypothetical protein As57867_017514 [Aphanomyces stellatus]VFT94325.1 Aste57867_17574 [Aphanomyces stellatus]
MELELSKRAQSRRQWYERNKTKAITQAKQYSQQHKERIAAQKKAWDARNREKKRAQMKAYYIRNKDRIKEYRERVKHGRSIESSSSSVASMADSDTSPPTTPQPNVMPMATQDDEMQVVAPVAPVGLMTASPHRRGATSPMNIAALLNPLL